MNQSAPTVQLSLYQPSDDSMKQVKRNTAGARRYLRKGSRIAPSTSKEQHVLNLAVMLMEDQGMLDWAIAFTNANKQLGCTSLKHGVKVLYFSRAHINNDSWDEVEDTVRHELAHALEFELFGLMNGHGPRWRRLAAELGAKPERTLKNKAAMGHRDYKWKLMYGNEVLAGYFRYPAAKARSLSTLQVAGRPETKGNIRLVEVI